jgi:Zn ribbon nucleic-acid-binding protein
MKAQIYRNGRLATTEVTEEDVKNRYTRIECPSCEGTGVFEISEEDSQDCVECSTAGEIKVPVFREYVFDR